MSANDTALPNPDEFLTTEEAAAVVRLKPDTLNRLRVTGEGAPFYRVGNGKRCRVVYKRSELIDWLQGFRRTSTSDTGGAQ